MTIYTQKIGVNQYLPILTFSRKSRRIQSEPARCGNTVQALTKRTGVAALMAKADITIAAHRGAFTNEISAEATR